MKERPIPFSAPMVRALLAGIKTQTRRAWREQPPPGVRVAYVQAETRCPYGQPGDRLWVREAYRFDRDFDTVKPGDVGPGQEVWYEAQTDVPFHPTAFGKLRPGIFMPRWASRITLEVTGVRVERLQDISEADAIAEGIVQEVRDPGLGDGGRPGWRWAANEYAGSAVHGYELLWEQINGPGSWDANPFVWVVTFRRIDHA